jgi:3-phenylpropionate/trans-cinnamate dioxygenase ferredoxin subunit
MPKYVVAERGEIPPGARKIVMVAGRSVGVFNIDGQYFAVLNRCPHQGAPLCDGQLWSALQAPVPGVYRESETEGPLLRCPWHGWEFDVRTGQSWFDPERMRVRRYLVTVEALTTALEKGPYVVETYGVVVDREVLVIEM